MKVLIICNDPSRDPGIAAVQSALARRDVEVQLFRADRFPVEERLTIHLNGERQTSPQLDGVTSIWLRHADPGDALPEDLREDVAAAIIEQAQNTLHTLISSSGLPCFDHPDTLLLAPSKPAQLAIARAVGLQTPRTLLTNDLAALRAFAAELPGGLITKMVESVRVHAIVDGAEVGGLTRGVTPADLDDEASLAVCPMIFQERVKKVRDWRVTVVGQRVFPATVRAGEVLDWRSERALIDGFEAATLPEGLEQKILAYCRRIGVQLAAFDFVEDAAGALTFIEANTTSYFHFVERATGQPISEAIADLITGPAPPPPTR
jgi:glutathione synthase/RimK-type ligase-like ATP-grasp enzyme